MPERCQQLIVSQSYPNAKKLRIQNSSYLCSPVVFIKLTRTSSGFSTSPLRKVEGKSSWLWFLTATKMYSTQPKEQSFNVWNVSDQQLLRQDPSESGVGCLYWKRICFVVSLGLSSPLVSLSPGQAAGSRPLRSAPQTGLLSGPRWVLPVSSLQQHPIHPRDNFIHLADHCIQLNEGTMQTL